MKVTIDRQAVYDLEDNKRRWALLPAREKVGYLMEMRQLTVRHAPAWARAGSELKGFAAGSPLEVMEEWLAGPMALVSYLTDLITTLAAIDKGENPLTGIRLRNRPDGQLIARVLPRDTHDRLLDISADVWMQPGVSAQELAETVAPLYREVDPPGRVALVLGAGNAALLTPLDVLSALIVDGDVVLVKMNPVNDIYGSVIEEIFDPLIREGFVRFVYGGGEVGAALVHDELVERVHMTGSAHTYDAIMWGTGPYAQARKESGEPLLRKPFTAELGGVSPTIVVPSRWSNADIALQAEIVATQKLNYSGHVCAASQVLVLPQRWGQADEFLSAVRAALTAAPYRESFYPGTEAKIAAFTERYPEAELLSCQQPRVLLAGVDPNEDHPGFTDELFAPILVTTSLPGDTPERFLTEAIAFTNDRLMGNLSANIIVDSAMANRLGAALEDRLADLKAGSIGVNTWSVLAGVMGRTPWGAYPGNTMHDIQSGTGVAHNALMFPNPEKNVLWGRFRPVPPVTWRSEYLAVAKPFWLVNNELTVADARALISYYANPNLRTLLSVVASRVLPRIH